MATTLDRKPANLVKARGVGANGLSRRRPAARNGLARVEAVWPRPHRWTKEQYRAMEGLGWFQEARVEFIEGEVIAMTAMNTPHWTAIMLADEALRRVFGEGFLVTIQLPFDAGNDSEPEPDVAVIKGGPRDFLNELPKHPLLVVEVSDSTLAFDRTRKAALYGRAGIAEYWIVNLKKRQLEVHRAPSDEGYTDVQIFKSKDAVSPLAAPDAKIKVADLLP